MSKRILNGIDVTGAATLRTVADAGVNTDKFLVLNSSGVVAYRTAAELYSDLNIANLPASYTSVVKHQVKLGEAINKGQAAYVPIGFNSSTNMVVVKASNASETTSSKTMGLIETSGVTNDLVNIVTEGLLAGLDTSTATQGDPVWLGTGGNLIFGLANKPSAPAHLVFLGIVTRVNQNNGEIFVKVQNGFELGELHNYAEGSVQNNQVITYESATSLYKPKSISTILGYTPANASGTTNYLAKYSGATTLGNSLLYDNGTGVMIGTTSGVRLFTVFSTTFDNHISAIGTGPSVSLSDTAIGATYQGKIGLATDVNHYASGAVAGDMVVSSQTGSILFAFNSVQKAKIDASGNLTANSIIKSGGTSSQYLMADGSVSSGPALGNYVPNTRTLTINGTTYDLSADRSWTINVPTRSETVFTATANQTTFNVSYTVGNVEVFYNGSKMTPSEFTATDGTSIVLSSGIPAGTILTVVANGTGGGITKAALSATAPLVYDSNTGVFSIPAASGSQNGYLTSANWTTFNNKQNALTLTVTGSSGAATLVGAILNIPTYTLAGLGGQPALNGTGFVKISGTTISYDNSTYLTGITSSQVTTALGYTPYNSTNPNGYITSSGTAAAINQTIGANGDTNLVYAAIADNDFFRIRVGGASNAGWVEIATADDGTEPIYVRQYTGTFGTVTRTATILDGSGNTTFPGVVTASSFSGTIAWSNVSGRPTAVSSFSNDSGYITSSTGSNFTINNSSPTIYLQDTDHRSSMIHCNSNIFYVLRGSGTNTSSWSTYNGYWPLEINLENNNATFGGNITAVYDVTAYSDARVKKNIYTIENALDKVMNLRGVRYQRTDMEDDKFHIGVIAQETQPIVPEVVTENDKGHLNVAYGNMGGLFIEAIKELKKENNELRDILKRNNLI